MLGLNIILTIKVNDMTMIITDFRGHLEAIVNLFTDNSELRDKMFEELDNSMLALAHIFE